MKWSTSDPGFPTVTQRRFDGRGADDGHPSQAGARDVAGPRIVTSETFLLTAASPDDVWVQLMAVRENSCMWGLAVETAWTIGAPLRLGTPGGPALNGRIVFAEAPRRLSFSLGDGFDASTDVTWEIRSVEAGTLVRLSVDDVEPATDSSDQLAMAWLPVLDELRRRLTCSAM